MSAAHIRAALAAAEARWACATWADAGMWKRSVHSLRDALAMAVRS